MAWVDKTIGDLGLVVTGKTPSTKNRDFYNGGYLFVTPTDLDWDSYYVRKTRTTVSDEAKQILRSKFLPKNSVFFTCIASVGKMGIASEECLTNQQINSIIPNEEFDSKFVYYLLRRYVQKIRSIGLSGGSAVPIINKSGFCKIKVRVPDNKKEQVEIGSILSDYDDLIENNRQRISLLEKFARLFYRKWFSEFHSKHGNQAVQTTFSDENYLQAVAGGTPSTKIASYWEDGDITWVTPTDITKAPSLVLLKSEKKITQDGLNNSSAKIVPANSILMTSIASVGHFGLIDEEACTNQGFINIVPAKEKYRYFLLFHLISRVGEIRSIASGSIFPEISKGRFMKLSLSMPPDSQLAKLHEVMDPIFCQMRNLERQVYNLSKARDLLLPRLMSGRINL